MTASFVGTNRIHLESVSSTNTYANDLLRSQPPMEGTLVWVDEQTEGRGQRGNLWSTEAGKNLTFSIILYPTFLNVARYFSLSKAVSLALMDFFASKTNQEVVIKWPNDIYIGQKKVAGILVENAFRSNWIRHSIIGIGINLNQLDFGPNLPFAGSLSQFTGVEYDRETVLDEICANLNARYLRLKVSAESMDEAYLNGLLGYRSWRYFRWENEQITAQIVGVEADGRLNLRTLEGQTLKVGFKELEFILEPPATSQ